MREVRRLGIIRNHYVGRTFIQPSALIRKLKTELDPFLEAFAHDLQTPLSPLWNKCSVKKAFSADEILFETSLKADPAPSKWENQE